MAKFLREFLLFVRLSRPLNVLISVVSFGLAAFLSLGEAPDFLFHPLFKWEAIAIVLITATGYWINDVSDVRVDAINKPHKAIVSIHLSVKKVLTVYFMMTILVLGYSVVLLPPLFIAVNLASIYLLYVYAQQLKRTAVIGNAVISLLASLVIFAGAVLYEPYRLSLIWAMAFAFLVTLVREIVKDVEDIRGDAAYGLKTLPVLAGIRTTRKVVAIGLLVLIVGVALPWVVNLALWQKMPWGYLGFSVLLVQLPLVYALYRLAQAKSTQDYHRISTLLKLVMIGGILSLLTLVKA